MYYVSEFICRFSLGLISGALLFLALTFIVLWKGGKVDKVKIPGLFDVTLNKPVVLPGNNYVAALSGVIFIVAALAGAFQFFNPCVSCEGLPGQTAWIYAGNVNMTSGMLVSEKVLTADDPGLSIQDIPARSWITLLQPRRTMILDYDTKGIQRALDSPFLRDGKVSYTCKFLDAGERLYVAEKKINGPNARDQHVWLRVRLTPVGQ